MENEFHNLSKVYEMLEDEESKDIYLNRLNYLISSDRRYIDYIVKKYLPELSVLTGKTIEDLVLSMPPDRKIVLYGAGVIGESVLKCFAEDKRFIGFCSQTLEKQQNGYLGSPVMSPEELLNRKDLSVVISANADAYFEIRQVLDDGGYPKNQIYDLSPYIRFGDRKQYFESDFISYCENEVFVDAGCYNLHTAITLKKYCKTVKKVYAFEPDPVCYQRCLEKKAQTNFDEAKIFPYGTWSTRATLSFDSTGDGCTLISQQDGGGESSCILEVVPIDEVIDSDDKVTFIKMDVEGAELESLKGAKQTIQRDKPKLAICIYHKAEDMITIPLYIKELVPEYKLYVRHYSNSAGETVLYAVMP